MPEMCDTFGRRINYLRVSVTDLCNLRCRYCMPAGGVKKMAHADMMSEDETITAIEAAVGLGVFKLRITGGEPLVKKNILSLCRREAENSGRRTTKKAPPSFPSPPPSPNSGCPRIVPYN